MVQVLKSAGHGLLAAGILLIAVDFLGAYLKGSQALRDAFDPLTLSSYLPFLALAPGAVVLWLADQLAMRRGKQEQT